MFVIVCSFAVCIAIGFALPPSVGKGRIIGGQNANSAQFKYQVSFRFINKGTHYCSGAILSNWFIITANRCVNIHSIESIKVVYGSRRLNEMGITGQIARIISHPDYNPQYIENNIALVMVKEKIEYFPLAVGTIKLPHRPSVAGEIATISGWGVFEKENERWECYSNVLQYQTTQVISNDECKAGVGPMRETIRSTNVCTMNPIGRGICKGDLGSPLLSAENELMAIASWHLNCADAKPDVYVAVYPYIEWIRNVTENTMP